MGLTHLSLESECLTIAIRPNLKEKVLKSKKFKIYFLLLFFKYLLESGNKVLKKKIKRIIKKIMRRRMSFFLSLFFFSFNFCNKKKLIC